MKCYKCNGTGYYDIYNECPVCDGTGEYEPFDTDVELDKLDSEPITNEEWIKSLDTEGLVDHLYEVHKGGNTVERQAWIEKHKERVKMQIRGWLKEVHKE